MNANCKDLDRILENAEPAELAALERHAQSCEACARELAAWNELSAAARTMRQTWESPALWPRIEQALAAEMAGKPERAQRRNFAALWQGLALHWQAAAAALVLAVLTASGAWMLLHRSGPQLPPDNSLLTKSAVDDVERAEAAYIKAIDNLAAQAKPKLENPATPLLASYREKLQVLDAAITDLRATVESNRANAHLRSELRSLYEDKQKTLEAVMKEE
jgi:hypothetical protein